MAKKVILIKDNGKSKLFVSNDGTSGDSNKVITIDVSEVGNDFFVVKTRSTQEKLNETINPTDPTAPRARNTIIEVEDMTGVDNYKDSDSALFYIDSKGDVRDIERRIIEADAAGELEIDEIVDLDYSQPAVDSGITPLYTFGDIADAAQRALLMSTVVPEGEYSFKLNGSVFRGVVITKIGDGTNPGDSVRLSGQYYHDGINEDLTVVITTANESEIQNEHKAARFKFPTVYQVTAYSGLDALPKDVIQELINSGLSSVSDQRLYLVLTGNQIESTLAPDGSEILLRMGTHLTSTRVSNNIHELFENSIVRFKDDYGKTMDIKMTAYDSAKEVIDNGEVLTDTHNVRQTIFDAAGQVVGSFFPKVTKITDWDNSWNGAGSPAGTDAGWKIELTDPRDKDGNTTTFPSRLIPLAFTLISFNNGTSDVGVILGPSDLIDEATWATTGKSQHKSGNWTPGQSIIFDGLIDARNEIKLGAYDNYNQYEGFSRDKHSIAPGNKRYVTITIEYDTTAGWQYDLLARFELVKTDGTLATSWENADLTKIKMTYVRYRGATGAGNAFVDYPSKVFTGFDLQEV